MYDHLAKEANNSLISEYAKRESSWIKLKEESYEIHIDENTNYFITSELVETRNLETTESENKSENNLMNIEKLLSLGNKFWDGVSKLIMNIDELSEHSTDIWEIANKIKKVKNLNSRDIAIGNKLLLYIEKNNVNIDEIKLLSNEIEVEVIDIKAVYDRLILISKNDWNKIIDLANQTKIFTLPELGNVKSLQLALSKNEQIKEQALMKAFESLLKLKKFGVKV